MATHTFYIKPGDTYEVLVGDWGGPYMAEGNRLAQQAPAPRTEWMEVRPGNCVAVVAPHATVYVKGVEPARIVPITVPCPADLTVVTNETYAAIQQLVEIWTMPDCGPDDPELPVRGAWPWLADQLDKLAEIFK